MYLYVTFLFIFQVNKYIENDKFPHQKVTYLGCTRHPSLHWVCGPRWWSDPENRPTRVWNVAWPVTWCHHLHPRRAPLCGQSHCDIHCKQEDINLGQDYLNKTKIWSCSRWLTAYQFLTFRKEKVAQIYIQTLNLTEPSNGEQFLQMSILVSSHSHLNHHERSKELIKTHDKNIYKNWFVLFSCWNDHFWFFLYLSSIFTNFKATSLIFPSWVWLRSPVCGIYSN